MRLLYTWNRDGIYVMSSYTGYRLIFLESLRVNPEQSRAIRA